MASPSFNVRSLYEAAYGFSVRVSRWEFKPLVLAIAALTAGTQVYAMPAATDRPQKNVPVTPPESDTQFDLDVLKQRGIDLKVAEFFSKAPRFTQGMRRVTVLVNGEPRGMVETSFDAEGQLCFNRALLDQANLKVPEDYLIGADADTSRKGEGGPNSCYDFVKAFPQTEVELRPGREEVALIVNTEALRPLTDDLGAYQRGGTAGLLNYDLIGLQN